MRSIILFLLLTTLAPLGSTTAFTARRVPPTQSVAATTTTKTINAPPVHSPITYFEVTKPPVSTTATLCSHHVLSHDFAYSYARPPVTAPYSPPSHCPFTRFSNIILEFTATSKGRQFDRIFGVWLDGVELLRSCTAEPTHDGIVWRVRKDVTKYSSSLLSGSDHNQTIAVYIGNVVDQSYTGVYHVNLTFHYYPLEKKVRKDKNFGDLYGNSADLILPVSRNLPLNDGLWFEIQNSTDIQGKDVLIPRNVYRAVLEVYVSFHENDEFWYSNLPDDYLVANNLSDEPPSNGAFREVLVTLDGDLVGSVWPFTVIFTGGLNPLLWRPITAIGSFDLPTYDIEITPFLGKLLDGKPHSFKFSVTNALNVWYVDANLHLWLDKKADVLKGQLLGNNAEPVTLSSKSNYKGPNGKFFTGATRLMVNKGWVESSKGNITTVSVQNLRFSNAIVLKNDGALQIVNQTIDFSTRVAANAGSSTPLYVFKSVKRFPLFLHMNQVDLGNNSYSFLNNVTLGFDEDRKTWSSASGVSSSSLRNHQRAEGTMVVGEHLVQSGLGSTHQVYKYNENNGGFCYFRNVRSHNYTIAFDEVKDKCEADT